MEIKRDSFDAARGMAGLVFRPVLISAMVTCIAIAWVWVLESDVTGWRGSYLIWTVGLVTLEVLLVERQLRMRRLALLEPRTWQTRLAEIGMMLLVVKAASYLSRGWPALVRDVPKWSVEPESFFDFDFVIGVLVVGTLWLLASSLAEDLAEIEDENNLPGEPEAAQARLTHDFIFGAILLLMAVGGQRVALSGASPALRPAQLGGLAALPVVYVGLGILLFGQVRLSLLLERWEREQVPVSSGIERRWAGWSLLFVAGISAAVLFLPAGETSLGVYVFTFIVLGFLFLGQLVGYLLYLLFFLILLPFGFLQTQTPLSPRLPQFPNFAPPPEAGAAPDWLSSIRTVLIAGLMLVMAFLIVRTYWQHRRATGIWKTIGDVLCVAWNALLAWLRGSGQRVRQLRRHAPAARGKSPRTALAWWSAWRAHTSRERVRRLYLALLERAARVDHARRPAQTPFEYSSDLQEHLDDAQGLSTLTEAFVKARYSREDFTAAQVSGLHRLWQRLREELRRL